MLTYYNIKKISPKTEKRYGQKNERGFSIVEVLVVIVVLAVIGATTWYVYKHHHHTTAKTTTTSTKSATSSTSTATDTTPTKEPWSSLPASLQDVILARWKVVSPIYANNVSGYATDPTCEGGPEGARNETWLMDNKYAYAFAGCGGGEVDLIVKVGTTWTEIYHGEDLPTCAVVEQYSYPTALMAVNSQPECFAADGTLTHLN